MTKGLDFHGLLCLRFIKQMDGTQRLERKRDKSLTMSGRVLSKHLLLLSFSFSCSEILRELGQLHALHRQVFADR